MPKSHKKHLTRLLAAGLAVCAIAPGTALAMPAIAGPPVPGSNAVGSSSNPGPSTAPSGGAGVTAQDYRSLDYRGPSTAPRGGAGVTAQDYRSLDYRAPTQTGSRADGAAKQDRRAPGQTDGRRAIAPTAPQWPVNPQPIAQPHSVATTKPSTDDGVDTGVWIALGAVALAVAGGIGFAGGQRLRTGRQGQPA